MKKLIIINGTMGIGKSTVCNELLATLTPSVYLDGDWCWNMNPFTVNEENIKMVEDNIIYLLRSFLTNSNYQYVIFCWVMHQQFIFDQLLNPLKDLDFELSKISLICSEEALIKRFESDIKIGKRDINSLQKSLERLPFYDKLDTIKIDVSNFDVKTTKEKIMEIIAEKSEG